jgi:transposase
MVCRRRLDSESHHVLLTDADGDKLGEKIFKHDGEGLAEMAAWLIATSGAIARLEPETGLGQEKHCDVTVPASLPGVGRIVLATLLAEAFNALRRRDYAALRSLTGVAPVTKRSGKSCIVVRRQACHDRPRQCDVPFGPRRRSV